MKATAYLMRFREGRERPIEVPEEEICATVSPIEHLFELAYRYGQNDFQPRAGLCSVSMGDLIEIHVDGAPMLGLVKMMGVEILPAGTKPGDMPRGVDAEDRSWA